ncbi:MAG: flagellar assembly peptidoglycan hydrolase FlgJ [Gammaproteobacteria bacterium]
MPYDASPTTAPVATDFQGLTRLETAARAQSPQAKVEAARQFEALFIQMMLKSMRDTVPQGGLFGSQQQRLYRGLYDQQLALNMAQGGGLGLRAMILRALGGTEAAPTPVSPATPLGQSTQPSLGVTTASAASASPAVSAGEVPRTPEAFVRHMMPLASRAARRLGVDPAVLVAQAALETGWGRHVPQTGDGRSSHNLFGIKTDAGWTGDKARVATLEYRDGQLTREQAAFRAYASPADCFDDYADLISGKPRYRAALAAADRPGAYLQALQDAGYATDPAYADKIQSILKRPAFATWIAGIKNAGQPPLT